MRTIKLGLLALLLFFTTALMAQSVDPDLIKGNWYTDANKSVVYIFKATNGKYYGKIVWLKNPKEDDGTDKVDDNNPDPDKRNTPLIGLMLLKSFDFDKDHWTNGTIYDPDNGKTYKCTISATNEDELFVRGYIGIPAIGRTTVWHRKK